MELKIGQEITVSEDFKIIGYLSDDVIQVKKGDKGYIDNNAFIHFETGAARGKMSKFDGVELKGYDTENIAKLIYEQLRWNYNIDDHLENYEIKTKDFIDDIGWVLSDVL